MDCCTPLAGATLAEEEAADLEQLLRSVADRHRLRILNMLVRAGGAPVCVCELTDAFELPQQNVSYHLKQLVDGALAHIAALVALPERAAA